MTYGRGLGSAAAAEGCTSAGGGLGAAVRPVAAVVVGASADDDADVVAIHLTVAIEIAIQPPVRSGAGAEVAQADDDADVIAIDHAVEVQVAIEARANQNPIGGQADAQIADVRII